MGTVPTTKLESLIRAYYLRWVAGIPKHEDNLDAYIDDFGTKVTEIIKRQGRGVVRASESAHFPAPKPLPLSFDPAKAVAEMKQAAIRSGIATGQHPREMARAMLNAGFDGAYYKLERQARTEVTSAYWAHQWKQVKDMPDIQMRWSVETGPRTCKWCWSKDGLIVDDDTLRDHPNGRCTLEPVLTPDYAFKTPASVPAVNKTGITRPAIFPARDATVPELPLPDVTSTAQWFRRQWASGMFMSPRDQSPWEQARTSLKAPWWPEGINTLEKINKVLTGDPVPSEVGPMATWLRNTAHPLPRRMGLYRGEAAGDATADTWLAPTALTTQADYALGVAVSQAEINPTGIVYMLDVPRGTRVIAGQLAEGELILPPGYSIKIIGEDRIQVEGKTIRVIKAQLVSPIVGRPYYGEGTYNVR